MVIVAIVIVAINQLLTKKLIAEQEQKHQLALKFKTELLHKSVEIQEKERSRFARELHDNLLGKLNIVLRILENDKDDYPIDEYLKESINTARRISHDLSPPFFESLSLKDLIYSFLEPLHGSFKINITINNPNNNLIEKSKKLHLYRIFQELISNIIKHAEASEINVNLDSLNNHVILKVIDNGKGFDDNKHKGLGIENIYLRSSLIKGKISFSSSNKVGTKFFLIVRL